MGKAKKILLLFILFIGFSSDAEELLLPKLENAYRNIQDAYGSFTQTTYIKEMEKTQKFRGNFYVKTNKLKWQYSGEFQQTIYLEGETLIIYDKLKKQALETTFQKQVYGQLPLALLSKMTELETDFLIKEKLPDKLILIPKTKMGNIKLIEVTLVDGDFPIKSLRILDNNENRIKIDFYDVKINTGLKDSIFKFIPQKDDTLLRY